LNSLKRERSEEFVFSGLLQIAVRLKSDHQEAPAQLLLERLSQADIPPEICEQAKREHGAMIGSGGSMMRLEYHLSGFAAGGGGYLREIAPVLGAGMLGQIAGTIFLGRLGGMAGRFWNRGWGRKLAVGAVSYLAELPAFVGLSRACSPEGGGALGPGWLPAALGLGVLRGSHFLGSQGVLGIQRLSRSAGLTKLAQTSLPLGTLFAGLYGSHHLQVALGLQPQVKDATTGVDVLHSMAVLLPGLSLGNVLLGRSWAALRREMEMRADTFWKHGADTQGGTRWTLPPGRQAAPAEVISGDLAIRSTSSGIKKAGGLNTNPLQDFIYQARDFDPLDFEALDESSSGHMYSPKTEDGLQRHDLYGFLFSESESGVRIYTPISEEGTPVQRGVMILISGVAGNYTSFGELPRQLCEAGWLVKLLTIPGYDRNDSVQALRVSPRLLKEYWLDALKAAVNKILKVNDEGPLVLGGFSLGGAEAIRLFSGLDPLQRTRVQAFVLGAPAFAFSAVEGKNPIMNWFTRYVVLPFRTLFNKTKTGKVPDTLAPELAPYFHTKIERPWRGEHAAVLTGEAARRDLTALENLPPALLIHSGRSDPTVSYKAARLAGNAFGEQMEVLDLENEDVGHYVFVGRGRQQVYDTVIDFLERKVP
jgi:alpha-beta hydrolase superfamily lysophospholipase